MTVQVSAADGVDFAQCLRLHDVHVSATDVQCLRLDDVGCHVSVAGRIGCGFAQFLRGGHCLILQHVSTIDLQGLGLDSMAASSP